jgi:DNA-binding transcriptional ArsR family regulator
MQDTTEHSNDDPLSPALLLEFYNALSDPTRLRLAGLLAAGPAGTVALSIATGQSPAAVARHLLKLVSAGVVSGTADGRYALDERGMRRRAKRRLDSPRTRSLRVRGMNAAGYCRPFSGMAD